MSGSGKGNRGVQSGRIPTGSSPRSFADVLQQCWECIDERVHLYFYSGEKVSGSPVFYNILAPCTRNMQAYRFLLEEFCLYPEWILAPFWPVIGKRKLRKPKHMCTQRTSL